MVDNLTCTKLTPSIWMDLNNINLKQKPNFKECHVTCYEEYLGGMRWELVANCPKSFHHPTIRATTNPLTSPVYFLCFVTLFLASQGTRQTIFRYLDDPDSEVNLPWIRGHWTQAPIPEEKHCDALRFNQYDRSPDSIAAWRASLIWKWLMLW